MKKFLLILPLLLAGCFHVTWSDSKAAPAPTPRVPDIIARGTDGIVNYSCQLEELNESLAWVQCDFHNGKPVTENACIKVSFYDETGKLVVESRRFCSGTLPPNQDSTNYAAFQKENRVTLRRCGELLDLCVMLAESQGLVPQGPSEPPQLNHNFQR
jgi:hypothetical protein